LRKSRRRMRGSLGEPCLSFQLARLPRSPPLEDRRMMPVPRKARVDPADRSSAANRKHHCVTSGGTLLPNETFFVRWHVAGIPTRVDTGSLRLQVEGHVQRSLALSLDDLRRRFERFLSSPFPKARVSRAACSSHVCPEGSGGTESWATRCGPESGSTICWRLLAFVPEQSTSIALRVAQPWRRGGPL
jgi:hypothetical protein